MARTTGAGRGAAPDRVPAGARPRGDLQGQGVPQRGRRDPAAAGDEVAAAVEAGTLTDLPGIGASTAQRDHRRGARRGARAAGPARGASTAGPLATGGAGPARRLRGDLHSHSDWSDGGSPIEEMAFTAIELGHDYLVLTDHSPRLTVANGLSAERLARQLDVVDAVNEHLGGAASRCSRASRSTSSTTAPRPDRRDARPARRPGGQRALQAEDGRRPR